MIRVNLLPQKREVRKEPSAPQGWAFVVLGFVLAEIVVLFFVQAFKKSELDKQVRKNREIQSEIEQIKTEVANYDEVKKKLAVLRAREQAIAKLQSARTGPTAVLLEISRLLSPGRGPTVDPDALAQLRRDNPDAVFNPGWDGRRLWLTAFEEKDRVVKMDGLARDGDDVSELARRLSLSRYFSDVKLLPATRTVDNDTKLELIKFELQTKARY